MNIYDIQGTSLQMCALDFFSFQQARPGLKPESACGCATKRPHLSVVSLLKSGYCTYCLLPFASLEAEKRDYEGFFSSCQIDLFTTDLNSISSRPLGRPSNFNIRVYPNITNCRARNINTLFKFAATRSQIIIITTNSLRYHFGPTARTVSSEIMFKQRRSETIA